MRAEPGDGSRSLTTRVATGQKMRRCDRRPVDLSSCGVCPSECWRSPLRCACMCTDAGRPGRMRRGRVDTHARGDYVGPILALKRVALVQFGHQAASIVQHDRMCAPVARGDPPAADGTALDDGIKVRGRQAASRNRRRMGPDACRGGAKGRRGGAHGLWLEGDRPVCSPSRRVPANLSQGQTLDRPDGLKREVDARTASRIQCQGRCG